jgi:8-oxo-dGTP pyrophosphatase MutT (NUDIX family)
MVNGQKLPDEWLERIEDLLAGRLAPPKPRDAATVAVLRDHAVHGLQVFMLRRVASMAFAPGAYVFPGGSVDPRDGDRTTGWAGPTPQEWGAAFGADAKLARELVCAAVRETFEETLVLLAGPTGDSVVGDVQGDVQADVQAGEDGAGWERDRQALLDRSQSFAEFLDRRGLVLRSDLLRPWTHWITPAIEPRRYDTRFFVAAMPAGQRALDVSTEADRAAWIRPADAVEAARRGEMVLLPPTLATLTDLTAYDSVAAVLAAERTIVVHEPTAEIIDGVPYLVLPGAGARPYPGA